jgi:hypothetical protein
MHRLPPLAPEVWEQYKANKLQQDREKAANYPYPQAADDDVSLALSLPVFFTWKCGSSIELFL